MEHAMLINEVYGDVKETCNELCNDQYIKHVGFSDKICSSECAASCVHKLFSRDNINAISCKITELLQGVNKDNRKIIVPDKTICSVMSAVYNTFRPETSDIYSRYNIPNRGSTSYTQRMIDEVINIIVSDVKVNLGMDECNSKLDIWEGLVLGDFNKNGLRAHSQIKLRERKPPGMLFFSNY